LPAGNHQIRVGEINSTEVRTEDGSHEVGTFLSVLKKGGLEEPGGCWPGQRVVSA
jgi:hypothetical protein